MSEDNQSGEARGGSDLGEEARRLVEAVQQWARRTFPAPPGGHSGPECQWCPLCQFASVLRGEHPEFAERVVDAGTALAGAVKALVESTSQHTSQHTSEHGAQHDSPQTSPDAGAPGPTAPGASSAQSSRVQRIPLTDPAEEAPAGSDDRPTEAT